MPDLHTWIAQKIGAIEETALDATPGSWVAEGPGTAWGEDKDAEVLGAGKLLATLAYERNGHLNADHIAAHDPSAVLRRCEADRRILARHRLDPHVTWTPACKGCGDYSDMELPHTENLNDCPELIDLAHAHGITEEILATLDQPEPPPTPPRPDPGPGFRMPSAITSTYAGLLNTTLTTVPPGPNWKDQP